MSSLTGTGPFTQETATARESRSDIGSKAEEKAIMRVTEWNYDRSNRHDRSTEGSKLAGGGEWERLSRQFQGTRKKDRIRVTRRWWSIRREWLLGVLDSRRTRHRNPAAYHPSRAAASRVRLSAFVSVFLLMNTMT